MSDCVENGGYNTRMQKDRIRQVIEGDNIILRLITMDDTDRIVRWRNNPEVRKNFIFRGEFTHETHRRWMETKVASGEVLQYIIMTKEEMVPVGSVYYRDLDMANNSAEYGVFIGEDSARRRGIGTETAKLFTRYGIEELGLHRISLRVLAGNDVAYRTYENAGFRTEGVFRDMVLLDGEYRDVIFMALLAEDILTEM